MKYRVTVNVDGGTSVSDDFSLAIQEYTIGVVSDGKQNIKQLYIEKRIGEDEELPTLKPGTGLAKHVFEYKRPACTDGLIEKLLYLESLGSFWWHIRSLMFRALRNDG